MAASTPVAYAAGDTPVWMGRHASQPLPLIPLEDAIFNEWPPSIICDIPKVEGYSAYVHPKVLDTGADRWNGHRYWMCNTNYPGTMDRYENPAIFVSEDGTSWAHFGDNPVVPVGEVRVGDDVARGPMPLHGIVLGAVLLLVGACGWALGRMIRGRANG